MTHPLTPREKVALKPCPFCGGEAEYFSVSDRVGVRCADVMCAGSHRLPSAGEDSVALWNRRTALASGSGDHAELASECVRGLQSIEDRICASDPFRFTDGTVYAKSIRVIEAFLAEIAAMREREKAALKECGEWARQAGEAIGKLETSEAAGIVEGWRARATEAERKLAEADEENTRWLFRMADIREASGIGVKPMLGEVPGALRAMRERLDEAVGLLRQAIEPYEHISNARAFEVMKNGPATRLVAIRTFLSKEAERG
jgi:hypothetical protein